MAALNDGRKFEHLSVFVECASNAVPKVETLARFSRIISQMGYDRLYLGTADTYKIDGEKYFGYMRGGYSAIELKRLDECLREVGVELVPAIQCLAHLQFMQNYSEYADIIDTGNILLADEEKTYAFIEKMFAAVSESFSSRIIHIGMDEAFFLGLGKYLKKHGYIDRTELMLRHLGRVVDIASKHGFVCQMWSDMFYHLITGERYSDVEISDRVRAMIPDGLELIYWNYLSEDRQKCSEIIKNHLKITDSVSYAGTVWKFIGFAPDNGFSMKICKPAADACVENGIKNVMVTLWADNGAEASLFSALPGLYCWGEYARGNYDGGELNADRFERITGVSLNDFMLLDLPNKPDDKKTYSRLNNKCFTFLYNDLLMGTFDSLVSDGIGECYEACAERLSSVPKNGFTYIFDCLSSLCGVLAIKAELPKRIRRAYDANDISTLKDISETDIPEYIRRLNAFFAAFEAQWLRENKSLGFETQCARIGGLIKRAEFTAGMIERFTRGEIDRIDVLDEPQQPFGYDRDASEDSYILMTWSKIVTHGFI